MYSYDRRASDHQAGDLAADAADKLKRLSALDRETSNLVTELKFLEGKLRKEQASNQYGKPLGDYIDRAIEDLKDTSEPMRKAKVELVSLVNLLKG